VTQIFLGHLNMCTTAQLGAVLRDVQSKRVCPVQTFCRQEMRGITDGPLGYFKTTTLL